MCIQRINAVMSQEDNLDVGKIKWLQGSISDTFKDGKNIQAAIDRLLPLPHGEREAEVVKYPLIRVVPAEHGWVTLDNRQLFLFKKVLETETVIHVEIVTLDEASQQRWKLTNRNGGESIVVLPNRHRNAG